MSLFKNLYPQLIVLITAFVVCLPSRVPGISAFMPLFLPMTVFFWVLYRPSTMSYWFLFIVGIAYDSVSGLPLCLTSLSLLLIRAIIGNIRTKYIRASLFVIYGQFALWLFFIMFIQWLIISILNYNMAGLNFAFMQYLLSVFAYPMVHYILTCINKTLPREG